MPTTYLLEESLSSLIERRRALVEKMAKDLIYYDALASDQDAVRILHQRGYKLFDVALLAGEARMVAYQEIVGKEMSKP